MRNESHKTLIGILREHVAAWRRAAGLSSASAIDMIVAVHAQVGGPAVTGIRFDAHTDEFQRMKNNSDRVLRWLDDETKDTNFLPANFVFSILAGMPDDARVHCLNEMLRRFGLCVRAIETQDEGGLDLGDICDLASADADALASLAAVVAAPTQANYEIALRKAARAAEKKARIVRILTGARRAMSRTRDVLQRVLHPGRGAREKA
ncbi:hypothetical protein LSO07_08595 [Janthinobacterium sp. PLB04]|uniref:Bacterial toxin YdaT domain-containing protein n=1 Tax=Janthinobacterium lividum TaxID=29581 RepID=A0AAJ4T759_9BURK|nr:MULTISPECIES: hypothetical protein [Janthinobacterium]KAB0331753.1 hypothetical protein F3B38_08675 [Janthinobacterium lividum]QSX97952.1 hypothetical protein J3P46_08585 [Janthinobacterium lividum]UGQ37922.1 hypothetical protein LSO07_08595 [Janthinobacterium sp. PLB04]